MFDNLSYGTLLEGMESYVWGEILDLVNEIYDDLDVSHDILNLQVYGFSALYVYVVTLLPHYYFGCKVGW